MTAKVPREIQGYEYDWLACDHSDRVALLSTGGGGYAPRALVADPDAYDRAIELLLAMPATTSARTAPEIADGLPNIWKQVAERGLFAFDSDPLGGPYRLVGIPRKAALLSEFPTEVAATVERVRLVTVEFDIVEEIARQEIVGNEAS